MNGPPNQDTTLVLSVSDFVALLNQTLEFAYPSVTIIGELTNFRVSKNKWVYFDLKDELASVKFFGTVYQLPGPLEDGMLLKVRGYPRLHPLYGFSVNVLSLQPSGEGSLKKAAALLQAKLEAEGLFDPARKRPLPYPPASIGLITSGESAAIVDFMKILDARWGGVDVLLIDVQVQGEAAPAQIAAAIEHFNQSAKPPEVLVITRGGGSAEDLAAFNTEQVTRGVAGSRIPTLVAIGHEVDISLAELAADRRASTPSNAAEMLVPDKRHELDQLGQKRIALGQLLRGRVLFMEQQLKEQTSQLRTAIANLLKHEQNRLKNMMQLLGALSPQAALKRGYAVIKSEVGFVGSVKKLHVGQSVAITMHDGHADAQLTKVRVE